MKQVFRPSSTQSPTWNLTKTLIQTAVFWSTLLWLVPLGVVRLEAALGVEGFASVAWQRTGWAILVTASFAGLWSGITMALSGKGTPLPVDTARELVITGPYRVVRNPMALAGITQGLAVGFVHGSWLVILYAVAGGVLWHLLVRPMEERDLLQRFGDEYEAYRDRVGLWMPRRPAT